MAGLTEEVGTLACLWPRLSILLTDDFRAVYIGLRDKNGPADAKISVVQRLRVGIHAGEIPVL